MVDLETLKAGAAEQEREGNLAAAIELYGRAANLARTTGEGLDHLDLEPKIGDLYLDLGDEPMAAYFYLEAADRHREEAFYRKAAAYCERALRVAPSELDGWLKLATIRVEEGLEADAKDALHAYLDGTREHGVPEGDAEELIALADRLGEDLRELGLADVPGVRSEAEKPVGLAVVAGGPVTAGRSALRAAAPPAGRLTPDRIGPLPGAARAAGPASLRASATGELAPPTRTERTPAPAGRIRPGPGTDAGSRYLPSAARRPDRGTRLPADALRDPAVAAPGFLWELLSRVRPSGSSPFAPLAARGLRPSRPLPVASNLPLSPLPLAGAAGGAGRTIPVSPEVLLPTRRTAPGGSVSPRNGRARPAPPAEIDVGEIDYRTVLGMRRKLTPEEREELRRRIDEAARSGTADLSEELRRIGWLGSDRRKVGPSPTPGYGWGRRARGPAREGEDAGVAARAETDDGGAAAEPGDGEEAQTRRGGAMKLPDFTEMLQKLGWLESGDTPESAESGRSADSS